MDYSYMYRCSHNESRREEAGDGFSRIMEEVSADVVLDLDTSYHVVQRLVGKTRTS